MHLPLCGTGWILLRRLYTHVAKLPQLNCREVCFITAHGRALERGGIHHVNHYTTHRRPNCIERQCPY